MLTKYLASSVQLFCCWRIDVYNIFERVVNNTQHPFGRSTRYISVSIFPYKFGVILCRFPKGTSEMIRSIEQSQRANAGIHNNTSQKRMRVWIFNKFGQNVNWQITLNTTTNDRYNITQIRFLNIFLCGVTFLWINIRNNITNCRMCPWCCWSDKAQYKY
jgi:hypothetical protein